MYVCMYVCMYFSTVRGPKVTHAIALSGPVILAGPHLVPIKFIALSW